MPAAEQPLFHFGAFELDLASGELRKNGVLIHLPPQPTKVLTLLVSRGGQLVTREELQREIWGDETFVDFEQGLNVCMKKIRATLGDNADTPRYIETLPRRGYRFIAPVVVGRDGSGPHMLLAPAYGGVAAVRRKRRFVLWSALGLAALVAGLWAWRYWTPSARPVLTERDTVVLGDVANSTGDPVFDATLRQGLAVELEQSPYLKLVSDEQIHRTLRLMGRATDVPLTPEIAREVCQRTDGKARLDGSIAIVGTHYNLVLRAVGCASGDVLASTEAQASDKNHVLDALSKVATDMRNKLGESLGTVQTYSAPLVQVTTPSLEALQSYSLGVHAQRQTGDLAASLPYFQKAVELDPKFAMAYWAMSDAYNTTGETALSALYMRRAYELRAGTSELERLLIEGDYHYYATGDLTKARRTFEISASMYPRNDYARNILGAIANILGQYETGLKEYRAALGLAPHNSILHRHVAYTYLLLNRVDDATAAAKRAHAQGLDSSLAPILYGIAFYRDDPAQMARQAASAAGKSGEEDLLLGFEADTAAYFGHLRRARELSRHAAESAERAGEKETAAGYDAVSALREALFGNASAARRQATTARRHSTGRDTDYGFALALAFAGDTVQAQALADELGRKFPDDSVVRLNYLPALRAQLALDRSDAAHALEVLGGAAPHEMGLPALGFYNWPNLYPVYVRGEAYLAAHQGAEAVAEFQKILDHRGIVLNEPIGTLAHLQLGRAYAISGDTARARAAYQDFLTLWKDADPDIPVLKQAKAEYAKLQ